MTVTARGSKGQIGFCFETTYGQTPASPNGILLPINSETLSAKQNIIEPATITGRRDPVRPGRGNIDVSGGLVVPIQEIPIGYLLAAMFGAPTTTGTGAPYTHVFKVHDDMPSFLVERQLPDAGAYFLYNGCKVSKFSMELGGDGELTGSIDIIGATETVNAASFDSSLTSTASNKFSNFQGSVEEGGAASAIIVSASLNIDFGLDGDYYAIGGQGTRAGIAEGLVQVSGSIRAFFKNKTLLDKAINDTTSSLKLKLTNGTHSLEFFMEEVIYERNSPGISGSKGILIELPYRAFYQSGVGNSVIVATLINSQASYTTA